MTSYLRNALLMTVGLAMALALAMMPSGTRHDVQCYYLSSAPRWSLSTSTTNMPDRYTVEVAPTRNDAATGSALMSIGTIRARNTDESMYIAQWMEIGVCQAVPGVMPTGSVK